MTSFHGIKIGGLQQKIFNLMLIFIIALVGVYVTAGVVLQGRLSKIVEKASVEQQSSMITSTALPPTAAFCAW